LTPARWASCRVVAPSRLKVPKISNPASINRCLASSPGCAAIGLVISKHYIIRLNHSNTLFKRMNAKRRPGAQRKAKQLGGMTHQVNGGRPGRQARSRAQGSIGVPPVFPIRVQDDDQSLQGELRTPEPFADLQPSFRDTGETPMLPW